MTSLEVSLREGFVCVVEGVELRELLRDRIITVTEDGDQFIMAQDYEGFIDDGMTYWISLESLLPASSEAPFGDWLVLFVHY